MTMSARICLSNMFPDLHTGAEVQVQLTAVDGRQLTEAEVGKPVWFGQVPVGARQQRVVRIENQAPVPLPFCWQQTDDPLAPGRSCFQVKVIILDVLMHDRVYNVAVVSKHLPSLT